MTTGVPEQLGGRYRLGELLGRGGMAEVHIGHDARLGRSVAVKMLRPDMVRDPTFQARFRREAHSAASLNHPSIVAVYDTGEDEHAGNPVPFIVMEYVDGSTLRELLASGSRLVPERALEIADGILEALSYSHQHGIVHRDIKPANVMLNGAGAVKVMDFGIARAVADNSSTMTQTSAVMGTAQYLSPEQARGEQVDARSDIYSTGCLLFELLTGRAPFVGDSPVSVAYQHVREEPVPPSSLDPDVPPAADAIVLKALTKDREQRYQTADEMRADIARALSGRPVAPPVAAPAVQTQRVAPPLAVPGTATFPAVEDVDRRDKGGRTLAYVLLGIAVLAVFVIAALVGKSLFGGGTVRVQVPDVRGLTVAQATTAITKAGLTVGQVTQENSATVDKGNVIDQSPEPRSELGKGGPVDLKVSAGVKESTVPTLVGLSLDEANNALRDAGLRLGTTKAVPSDKPQNVVVKADPAEGTNVATGSKVNLEYASGSNKVPKVTGMSADQARSALQDAGFQVTEQEREDATHPPGTVIEQSPAAGKAARLDSTVRIIVAKAPPPTPTDTVSLPTPTIT
ncbi:MAG: eukaryotic-like serine/threonine-protein kinase [Actinomycetota bacterium]|nr:eukaryotic-like serine/threonine-protein kinase [Actinomycetota bacterium]